MLAAELMSSVPAEQFVFEVDGHFGDHWPAIGALSCRNFKRCDEVFLGIGARNANGQLASGEDDGLSQIFEEKTECAGGVRHGIGAVKKYEAVVGAVVGPDEVSKRHPSLRIHVATVYYGQLGRRIDVDIEVPELWNFLEQFIEIEGLQRRVCMRFDHANGAARVNK